MRAKDVTAAQRIATEDRVIAALKERGLASTGQLRKLSGPHLQTIRSRHGHWYRGRWFVEPGCTCTETLDVTRFAAPLILQILKGLERRNLVLRIEPPQRNNGGGYQWLWIGE